MSVESHELIFAMVGMVLWTFLVMLRNVQVRVRAVLRGELTNEYFEVFRGAEPSEVVLKTGNHLRNLFEFPVLFYIACVLIVVTGATDSWFVYLAWGYVALRVAHSLVHLTFNKIPPRFLFYILSNIVLLVMWARLALSL